MIGQWKQYRVRRVPRKPNEQVQFNRDDDWAYKVARYMDMRINQADDEVQVLQVDLYETQDEFVIQAPAVGAKSGGVEVTYQQDALLIRTKVEEGSDNEVLPVTQIISERPHGLFARRLTLPGPVVAEQASAKVKNGLLTVRLPRSGEKGSKQVQILFADTPGEVIAAFD
jgi:HSP20 family protein